MKESCTPTGGEPDGASDGTPDADPRPGPMARRENAVLDILRRCVKDIGERHPDGRVPHDLPLRLDLRLDRDADGWQVRFDPPLGIQLLDQVQDALAETGVFREGRVYCFKCGSSGCVHAQPTDPGEVFAGYDPMGMPEWKGFAQALLDSRDPRVDQLYAPSAPLLARAQSGRELKARQLPSFGRASRAYGLLGQVVAGYLPKSDEEPGAVRRAVTFQAVETFDPEGAWSLELNLVSAGAGPEGRPAWLDAERLDWLRRARDGARRDLARIRERARAARIAREPTAARRALTAVPGVLARLVQSIERGGRQTSRRTRHAEERRRLHRPVHMAVADALTARADQVFLDERTDGRVVCGAQGRAHVFSRDGRHVTSFVLPPDGAAARVRSGRWVPVEPSAFEALQAGIARNPAVPT